MRQELIMDALNFLDEDILVETDVLRREGRHLKAVWWKWAGLAACMVLMTSGVLIFRFNGAGHGQKPIPPVEGNGISELGTTNEPVSSEEPSGGEVDGLPLLTAMDFSAMGAGFEALMAYDVSELVSGNPWSESDYFSTLPVYQNPINIDEGNYFKVTGMDAAKMWKVLQETVDRLGLDNASLEMAGPSISLDPSEPVEIEAAMVSAKGDGIKIEVSASLTVEIIFDPPVTLPDSCRYNFYESDEERAALGEYLQDAFSGLIGWNEPTLAVTGGGYNINGNQSYGKFYYNGAGDLKEKFLNYSFYRIAFYSDSHGNQLHRIRIFQPDRSQKLGDYPIITVSKARELLLEGKYVTSVPYDVPGEEYVASVELVYSTGEMDEYFMPYYRFYVELPEERNVNQEAQERGLLTYGIYYVPAVEEKYLDGKPLWHFNF